MDTRIESSLKKLKEAYLEEKRKKCISEIKVIDVCKKAGVNKTTFYRHYRDIYDLADTIENETIDEIINQINNKDKLLTEPELFVKDSMAVFDRNWEEIKLIFDNRYGVLIDKIEKAYVEYYLLEKHSQYETLLIKFCVGGASHIITGSQTKEESEQTKAFLIKMLKKMI